MNMANVAQALEMMAQGMAGIFTVLGVIALTVALLSHMDAKKNADAQKNSCGHVFE